MSSVYNHIFNNPGMPYRFEEDSLPDQVAQRVRGGLYPAPVIEVWNFTMDEVGR